MGGVPTGQPQLVRSLLVSLLPFEPDPEVDVAKVRAVGQVGLEAKRGFSPIELHGVRDEQCHGQDHDKGCFDRSGPAPRNATRRTTRFSCCRLLITEKTPTVKRGRSGIH